MLERWSRVAELDRFRHNAESGGSGPVCPCGILYSPYQSRPPPCYVRSIGHPNTLYI